MCFGGSSYSFLDQPLFCVSFYNIFVTWCFVYNASYFLLFLLHLPFGINSPNNWQITCFLYLTTAYISNIMFIYMYKFQFLFLLCLFFKTNLLKFNVLICITPSFDIFNFSTSFTEIVIQEFVLLLFLWTLTVFKHFLLYVPYSDSFVFILSSLYMISICNKPLPSFLSFICNLLLSPLGWFI